MSEIKAIPTRYKGYHFRSRLEARWAVFFDALGLDWEYEPEGFDVYGEKYLPDFIIRRRYKMPDDQGVELYVEVKPEKNISAFRKSIRFWNCTGKNIMLLGGTPDDIYYPVCTHAGLGSSWAGLHYYAYFDLEFELEFRAVARPTDLAFRPLRLQDSVCRFETKPTAAIHAARSARFEYGQCGPT